MFLTDYNTFTLTPSCKVLSGRKYIYENFTNFLQIFFTFLRERTKICAEIFTKLLNEHYRRNPTPTDYYGMSEQSRELAPSLSLCLFVKRNRVRKVYDD